MNAGIPCTPSVSATRPPGSRPGREEAARLEQQVQADIRATAGRRPAYRPGCRGRCRRPIPRPPRDRGLEAEPGVPHLSRQARERPRRAPSGSTSGSASRGHVAGPKPRGRFCPARRRSTARELDGHAELVRPFPVAMCAWVLASISGLTLSAPAAFTPRARASASGCGPPRRPTRCVASREGDRVIELVRASCRRPVKTICGGSNPARRAASISPPEFASAPVPRPRRRRRMASVEFALQGVVIAAGSRSNAASSAAPGAGGPRPAL